MKSIPVQESSPLIFVVDDDRSMRALLRVALEQAGYQVFEAENSAVCIAAYQHYKPSAILLDVVMPGMNGFECCSKLRTLPSSAYIPILVISVLNDTDSIERAFAVGASDYITKPINWALLRHRLRNLLQQSLLSKQLETANRKLECLSHLLPYDEAQLTKQRALLPEEASGRTLTLPMHKTRRILKRYKLLKS